MAKKIRLLMVDDEERFVKQLAERLSLRDFDVIAVTSGIKAVTEARKKKAEALGQDYDVALVDLKMPGMSGEDVLETLKKEHPQMEVIILTGYGSIESAVRCTQAGSYTYLQKPCELDELLQALKEAYQKKVQRKLKVGESKLREMMGLALVESPLGIMRRLRDLEEKES